MVREKLEGGVDRIEETYNFSGWFLELKRLLCFWFFSWIVAKSGLMLCDLCCNFLLRLGRYASETSSTDFSNLLRLRELGTTLLLYAVKIFLLPNSSFLRSCS